MDARLFRWFNRLADDTAWAHGAVKAYAVYGIVLVGVVLVAAWWDARSAPKPLEAIAAVGWAGAAALVGVGLVQIIGGAIDRARPTTVLPGTHLLLDKTADFAFPSDHLTAISAVAAVLLLTSSRFRHHWYGWAVAVVAVLMAFARVYVGAHYPGNVLGGVVLGTLVGVLLAPSGLRACLRLAEVIAKSPLRPLVDAGRETPPVMSGT